MDSSLQNDQDDLKKAVSKKRILVADDDESVRATIKFLLEDTGLYSVQTAQDGEAAISLLKQQTFDLLITDYNMPKMNGYELFKRCKTINSRLLVIFITGNNFNEGVIKKIKSQGNVDCIYKPFNAESLFKIVDILIRMNTTS
ncbi:MAG: response regulator [Candidatus Scalindua sp.]|nr:response regulator [Candidatus Scalindua sp.]MCR4343212.1 response regulator [Candidatus Scalindua sp.]